MRSFASLPFVALVAATPMVAAAAPNKQACVAAYEETQLAMRRSRLLHAREALHTCLDEACPTVLRSDCAEWLKEVEKRTPSVVVEAAAGGTAIPDARLFVDGELHAAGIDGKAMELEPGTHTFRVETSTAAPVTVEAVVREGEKLKVVRIELPGSPSADQGLAGPASSTPAEQPPSARSRGDERRPIPWTVYAAAGVGGVAAVGFGWFALEGSSMKNDLEPCKPNCSAAQISDVRTQFILADVFLSITALALGTATYLLLTRPSAGAPTATPAWSRTALSLGPGGGRLLF